MAALASCLLAFISAGCVGGPSFDGEAWYIRIHDRFGRPIAGAELRCDGMEAPMYSDARGRVVIAQSAPIRFREAVSFGSAILIISICFAQTQVRTTPRFV
jgi:hypothetical protein